ncbi:hypothetical protein Tco_0582450 [Tanacetum coccineum]
MYYEVAPHVVFRCIVVFLGVLHLLFIVKTWPSAARIISQWSESDDDEPTKRQPSSSPIRENSVDMLQSDSE